MGQHGITTTTTSNMIINAGAIYKNYGETDEALIGATGDGNSFTIEQDIREVEIDGSFGPIKGGRRIVRSVAKIETNLIEMSKDSFLMALVGSDAEENTTDGTWDITRTSNITNDDYITNIAVVGTVSGSATPVVCLIKNALADDEFSIEMNDEEEAMLTVQFTAHYDPSAMSDEPWEIRYPIDV